MMKDSVMLVKRMRPIRAGNWGGGFPGGGIH